MDKQRRKELAEQYKGMKTYMGIAQVKNTVNGKIFLKGTPNLKSQWLTLQGQLNEGKHANKSLQTEWKSYGSDAFTYKILEEKDTEGMVDVRWEVKQLEKAWLEKLQPYGEKGYHKIKYISDNK